MKPGYYIANVSLDYNDTGYTECTLHSHILCMNICIYIYTLVTSSPVFKLVISFDNANFR